MTVRQAKCYIPCYLPLVSLLQGVDQQMPRNEVFIAGPCNSTVPIRIRQHGPEANSALKPFRSEKKLCRCLENCLAFDIVDQGVNVISHLARHTQQLWARSSSGLGVTNV